MNREQKVTEETFLIYELSDKNVSELKDKGV